MITPAQSVNEAFGPYLWRRTSEEKPPVRLVVMIQQVANGATFFASRHKDGRRDEWRSCPGHNHICAPVFWCRIMRNHLEEGKKS